MGLEKSKLGITTQTEILLSGLVPKETKLS